MSVLKQNIITGKKNDKDMEDQINANKISHLSAIYIHNMKITRSLCKKLELMIKSVKKNYTYM